MRKAFSNATAEGKSVMEMGHDKKAQKEIVALHDAIYGKKKTNLKHI
jgi:hypothetical protein